MPLSWYESLFWLFLPVISSKFLEVDQLLRRNFEVFSPKKHMKILLIQKRVQTLGLIFYKRLLFYQVYQQFPEACNFHRVLPKDGLL